MISGNYTISSAARRRVREERRNCEVERRRGRLGLSRGFVSRAVPEADAFVRRQCRGRLVVSASSFTFLLTIRRFPRDLLTSAPTVLIKRKSPTPCAFFSVEFANGTTRLTVSRFESILPDG